MHSLHPRSGIWCVPAAATLSVFAMLYGLLPLAAYGDLIAYWNFNGLTPNSNNGTVYTSDFGLAQGTLNAWTPAGINANGGTTKNALFPDGPGQALELRNDDNNGASLVINTDLTYFTNPILSYANRRNAKGFDSIQVAYSTDGVNYFDFGGPYDPSNGSYQVQAFDFSSIDALDGASDAYFRLTFAGACRDSGRVRIDNIQLNGVTTTAIPEPSTVFAMGFMFISVVAGRWIRRRGKLRTSL